MPVGLQTFDASGRLKLSLGDRIARLTGAVMTGGVDGAVVVAGVDTGAPFFILTAVDNPLGFASPPKVTISGNVISWAYPVMPGSPQRTNCLLRFGVY